jgi:hypothetical protein
MVKLSAIPNPGATALLGAFFLIFNVGSALYATHGLLPSGGFVFLYYVLSGLLIANWLHADNRRLGLPEVMDQGWLVYMVWPLAFPYHLFKTRGRSGVVTLIGFVVLFLATYEISLLVFYLAKPGRVAG